MSQEVHDQPNLFTLLIHSLCPGIYGHEMIKAGLILSLFGGNNKSSDSRDDIHVLIVGDPGLGKSQMLQACARVAPKGNYQNCIKRTFTTFDYYNWGFPSQSRCIYLWKFKHIFWINCDSKKRTRNQ